MKKGRVLIVDANNMASRARYAFNGFTVGGKDVSVIYGFIKVLGATIRKQEDITEVVLCWDFGKSSKRRTLFPEYKAHRVVKAQEDDSHQSYIDQMNETIEILKAFPVAQVKVRGVEADDILAVVAEMRENILLCSADKDLFQLISSGVELLCPIPKNQIITKKNFKRITGVPLEKYLFYKAIIGDPSDGINGVNGMGDVRAKKAIERISCVDDFAALGEMEEFSRYVNPESVKIFKRNVQIMSLGRWFLNRHQTKEILTAVDGKRNYTLNHDEIKGAFLKRRFMSFLQNYPSFISPFRRLT